MSNKIVFDHYRTAFNLFREMYKKGQGHGIAGLGPDFQLAIRASFKAPKFYEMIRQGFFASLQSGRGIARHTVGTYRQLMEEYRWYRCGTPKYRVYPDMLFALSRISIDIDAGELRMPFPAFTIEVPENLFRENEESPYLKGMLVHCRRRGQTKAEDEFNFGVRFTKDDGGAVCEDEGAADEADVMILDLDFGNEVVTSPVTKNVGENPCKPYAVFDIDPGRTIVEAFNAMPATDFVDEGYMPSAEFQKACLRVAVGVAFFAVNNHEVVARDIPPGLLERRERAIRTRNKKLLNKTNSEMERQGYNRCFTVGRTIVLPRHEPEKAISESDSGESKRELSYSHLRSGFMRWQAHGPKEDRKHKLIFIPPTRVRADLPFRPVTPRTIK